MLIILKLVSMPFSLLSKKAFFNSCWRWCTSILTHALRGLGEMKSSRLEGVFLSQEGRRRMKGETQMREKKKLTSATTTTSAPKIYGSCSTMAEKGNSGFFLFSIVLSFLSPQKDFSFLFLVPWKVHYSVVVRAACFLFSCFLGEKEIPERK